VADPISDLAATPGPASVTLTWTPPTGCTDITLYYKKTTTGALAVVPGATITSAMNNYTVRNLDPSVVYVFFLDVVGGDNQGRSNEVSVTPLAAEPTPTAVPTTTPGPTSMPSVTVTITPSVSPSASGASGGGGCTIGVFSFSMILFTIPIFVLSGRR
jgi:hypothetical protein